MWIEALECKNFRNYKSLSIKFDSGVNFLYGDNAQGKTNILEAVYLCSTSRSYKSSKDRELIYFDENEAHLRLFVKKKYISHKIDVHISKNGSKGVAIDGFPIRKASELLGYLKLVLFSPEDLLIVKNGPSDRRRFIDRELCQIDGIYMKNLADYNKIINQRNKLLKDIYYKPKIKDTLDVWDEQLIDRGKKIISARREFLEKTTEIMRPIHQKITGNQEKILLRYEPSVTEGEFADRIYSSRERDIALFQTNIGPHRDDFSIISNDIDLRKFGSQGQQRSAALSIKLSEIKMIQQETNETPVLLLDDVFSELDMHRQEYLLSEIKGTQNILTGTGLDDFIRKNIKIDRLFYVSDGHVSSEEEDKNG